MEILGRKWMIGVLMIILFSTIGFAQKFNRIQFPVQKNQELLPFPLVGGLTAPQYNAIDLNQDGVKDLVVFDRDGDVLMPFLNEGVPGQSSYKYAPEFINNFPKIVNWMLLRDYNGDGVEDIFAYPLTPGISGVEVYKAFVLNGEVGFEKVRFPSEQRDLLYIPIPSGGRTQLYVSNIDIPDVNDIDGDGDLDILTFNSLGGKIEFYQNNSVERGYGLDTLIYTLKVDCWGGIYESGNTPELDLSTVAGLCAFNFTSPGVNNRHTGSTVLTIDMDNDCDKEIFLGDLSFNHIVEGKNGGNCSRAWVNSQDTFFPSYDVPVNLPSFPASFYVDVDNDGANDFLASRNSSSGGEDIENTWFYKNTANNETPQFELIQKDFMTDKMLDFGSISHPAIADINGDGLLDIVVGIEGIYGDQGNSTDARLNLLLNIGTPGFPVFELTDDDWLNFKKYTRAGGNNQPEWGFSPTFGDLDNDGDLDLMVGMAQGQFIVSFNTAGPNQAMNFGNQIFKYKGMDVGNNSTPCIYDFNKDGLPDIISGEQNGNLNYFQNIGTPDNPDFATTPASAPNSDFFGQIDLREQGSNSGYGTPVILNFPDKTWLLIGKELGGFLLYDINTNNPADALPLLDSNFGLTEEGLQTHAAMGDLNQDGELDMIVGNRRGGITIFKTGLDTNGEIVSSRNITSNTNIRIFPNPTDDFFIIESESDQSLELISIKVYDVNGKLMKNLEGYQPGSRISIAELPSGFFTIIMEENTFRNISKLVKY
jgi:hypothetical protein